MNLNIPWQGDVLKMIMVYQTWDYGTWSLYANTHPAYLKEIPQGTSPISHNAPFCNRICTYLLEMWCMVWYLSSALCDLWGGNSLLPDLQHENISDLILTCTQQGQHFTQFMCNIYAMEHERLLQWYWFTLHWLSVEICMFRHLMPCLHDKFYMIF